MKARPDGVSSMGFVRILIVFECEDLMPSGALAKAYKINPCRSLFNYP